MVVPLLCREKLFAVSGDDRTEEAELSGLMNQTLQIEREVSGMVNVLTIDCPPMKYCKLFIIAAFPNRWPRPAN